MIPDLDLFQWAAVVSGTVTILLLSMPFWPDLVFGVIDRVGSLRAKLAARNVAVLRERESRRG